MKIEFKSTAVGPFAITQALGVLRGAAGLRRVGALVRGGAGRLKKAGVAVVLLSVAVGAPLASAQDQTPPNLESASVSRVQLTLTFDEDLASAKDEPDETSLRQAFAIRRVSGPDKSSTDEHPQQVSVAGKIVTLTLKSAVSSRTTITLSYDESMSDDPFARQRRQQGGVLPLSSRKPTVSARTGRSGGNKLGAFVSVVTAATVQHAGSTGAFTSVTMVDDGTNGDAAEGDRTFSALVPVYEDDLPALPVHLHVHLHDGRPNRGRRGSGRRDHADDAVHQRTHGVQQHDPRSPRATMTTGLNSRNTGTEAIDLGGMYLSDKTKTPLKWQFPAGTTIAAGGYLLIWADDDEGDSPGLHTNFKLSAGGESVVLSDIDARGNVVIDSVDFPAPDPPTCPTAARRKARASFKRWPRLRPAARRRPCPRLPSSPMDR